MIRTAKKRKWAGFCFLLHLLSLAPAIADTDLAADSVDVKLVKLSTSGKAYLFQLQTEAPGLRGDQVIQLRSGAKKIMSAHVLKKEKNWIYLKRVEADEGVELKEGVVYTAVFSVRRADGSGDNRTDSDSWRVKDADDSLHIFAEPMGAYSMGWFNVGGIDLSQVDPTLPAAQNPAYSTSSMGGGLRAGAGTSRYFLAFDFRYQSVTLSPSFGRTLSSTTFGVSGGTVFHEDFRVFGGFDFINRLIFTTASGYGGYTGGALRLGLGYFLMRNVCLNLEMAIKTYTSVVVNGSSVSMSNLSTLGFPNNLRSNDYGLSLSFPFLIGG